MPVKSSLSVPTEKVSNGTGVTKAVLISDQEGPNFAMRCFTIQPGGSMPLHTNLVEHEQYVLQGQARIGLGNKVYFVHPGDVIFIPADLPHFYENTGQEPFQFLCVVPNKPDKTTLLTR